MGRENELVTFHSVGVSGPSQSACRPWDVIYFVKGVTKSIQISFSKVYFVKVYLLKYIFTKCASSKLYSLYSIYSVTIFCAPRITSCGGASQPDGCHWPSLFQVFLAMQYSVLAWQSLTAAKCCRDPVSGEHFLLWRTDNMWSTDPEDRAIVYIRRLTDDGLAFHQVPFQFEKVCQTES